MTDFFQSGSLKVGYEAPTHSPAIESLLDQSFGTDRMAKTSYRYRDGIAPVPELCFTAVDQDTLVGTVRHWPLAFTGSDMRAILLGPIAVDPSVREKGVGAGLIGMAIAKARANGQHVMMLVGDLPYYARFGFQPAAQFGLTMPNENPERVLALPLTPEGWSLSAGGVILPAQNNRPKSFKTILGQQPHQNTGAGRATRPRRLISASGAAA